MSTTFLLKNINMKIKLNVDLGTYKKDSIITIPTDENDIPLDKYWRSRLKDSKRDGCVEVLKEKIKSTNKRVK